MTGVWVPGFDEVLQLFEQYRREDKRLNRKAEELEQICIRETSYISRDPTKSFHEVPELQMYVEQREQKRDELMKQLKKVSLMFDKVIFLMDQLSGKEYDVMKKYYILGHTMVKVAREVSYSVVHCCRIRDDAIRQLVPIYNAHYVNSC